MKLTLKVAVISVLSAAGLALRTVAFPITANVQITPGMIMPILSGILLGLWPGVITGVIVGVYAAVFSGEFWLIPLIGNVCLSLGAGVVTAILKSNKDNCSKMVMLVASPSIIGGFAPTFIIISLITPGAVIVALISGVFDMINALIASILALIAWSALKKAKLIERLNSPVED
ncbi:MAG: hypothetical protein OdinLCB4_003270 [Candidatus Odinarchaeum yellowstonii]|uniref:Uncharacterized protein n=1 Tax=Odinarchaeota yellowstonii (strain LCB_4) TaxID=1841599 RepID=A0AAF0D3D6_ODILC|nr:MAG: hypothetical protein OdinLCB4_003270 [Candidatus Odinarchaeum yellowstonii]